MTTFYNNKQETQDIKKFIKTQQPNKLVEPKEKINKTTDRTLPIRNSK